MTLEEVKLIEEQSLYRKVGKGKRYYLDCERKLLEGGLYCVLLSEGVYIWNLEEWEAYKNGTLIEGVA